jgi:two-component system KDP operon response regulator KdpE
MVSKAVILAVDDDPVILRLLSAELGERGFHVLTAASGREALQVLAEQRPDLILLDIELPDGSGLDLLPQLRERIPRPIILVSARKTDQDKVGGLLLGGDDYLTKPFNLDELEARVGAVLRRSRQVADSTSSVVQIASLEIDLERRTITRNGEPISLTRTEWNVLEQLVRDAGKVVPNAEILTRVWGPEFRDDLHYLRVWVSRLRAKLDVEDNVIRTVRGIGYIFDPDVQTYQETDASALTA